MLQDVQTGKQFFVLGCGPRLIKINLQKALERVHEKRLAETARPSDQQHAAFRLHQRLDEIRLINVITIVPDHVRKIIIADGQFLQHGGSLFEKNST